VLTRDHTGKVGRGLRGGSRARPRCPSAIRDSWGVPRGRYGGWAQRISSTGALTQTTKRAGRGDSRKQRARAAVRAPGRSGSQQGAYIHRRRGRAGSAEAGALDNHVAAQDAEDRAEKEAQGRLPRGAGEPQECSGERREPRAAQKAPRLPRSRRAIPYSNQTHASPQASERAGPRRGGRDPAARTSAPIGSGAAGHTDTSHEPVPEVRIPGPSVRQAL